MFYQQQRPTYEQEMPDWMRDSFDRENQRRLDRRQEQPELYAQLDRIESKLDQFLAMKRDCRQKQPQ